MDLIISDFHLSDNPLEEYRWKVFEWLAEFKVGKKWASYNKGVAKFDTVYILGDLTEKKDNHGARLVNRLCGGILNLRDDCQRMVILRGNHDGIDPEWPFFGFLAELGIEYYYQPSFVEGELFLPYSKDIMGDIKKLYESEPHLLKADRIFLHQTIKGVKVNGITLDGFDPGVFHGFNGLIFSGDIHVPQVVGKVNYVGSPYSIYFGDSFVGGGVLLNGTEWKRVEYPTIRRVMQELDFTNDIVQPWELEVNKGDQFKIRLVVNRSDSDQFDFWKKQIKSEIEDRGGILVSIELKLAEEKSRLVKKRKFKNIEPETVLHRFVVVEGLDTFYEEKGREFL